jgi:hypothetical protein
MKYIHKHTPNPFEEGIRKADIHYYLINIFNIQLTIVYIHTFLLFSQT